jgi:enediyne biosynthesis protein E4
LHSGLGKAASANLSIRWLDGKIENSSEVAAGQVVTIQEGKGIIKKQPFTSGQT